MNEVTKTVQSTHVSGVDITQDAEGRYSLNDLHRAAMAQGSATKSQRPGDFLRNAGVRAFIDALDAPEQGGLTAQVRSVKTDEGRYGGTFGSRPVVLRYAAWINPRFEVEVYRTFDREVQARAKLDEAQQIQAFQATLPSKATRFQHLIAEGANVRHHNRLLEEVMPHRLPVRPDTAHRLDANWVGFGEVKRLLRQSLDFGQAISKEHEFLLRAAEHNLVALPPMTNPLKLPEGYRMTKQGRDFIRVYGDGGNPVIEYRRNGLPVLVALLTKCWDETDGYPAWLKEAYALRSTKD